MKKSIYFAGILAMLAFPVAAGNTKTVYYPKEQCTEILSQEYSTGGGNTMWQFLEILCRDSEGNYTGYVTKWDSVSGALGFGRIDRPERFNYVPHNKNFLEVK